LKEHSNEDSLKWKILPVQNDLYFIVSVKNNKVLDQTRRTEKSPVILWELHRGDNQQWKIITEEVYPTTIKRLSLRQRLYNSMHPHLTPQLLKNLGLFNINQDIFFHILLYLPMSVMAKLRLVCRSMRDIMPTYWTLKMEKIRISGKNDDKDQLFINGPGVRSHILRIFIHINWSDQGWGNENTQLFFLFKT